MPLRVKDYVHFNRVCNGDQEEECVMVNDAIVLWGLLLLYGIPICAIAYWLERMITKGEENE
jgi:hypothetical protein